LHSRNSLGSGLLRGRGSSSSSSSLNAVAPPLPVPSESVYLQVRKGCDWMLLMAALSLPPLCKKKCDSCARACWPACTSGGRLQEHSHCSCVGHAQPVAVQLCRAFVTAASDLLLVSGYHCSPRPCCCELRTSLSISLRTWSWSWPVLRGGRDYCYSRTMR
jgi:hypothetical protein